MFSRSRSCICVIVSFVLLSYCVSGCGSSSHRTLFMTAAGTPSVAALDIGSSGQLILDSTSFAAGSDPQVIAIDGQRRYAYVLNNSGTTLRGGVSQFTIDRGKGTLTVVQAPDPQSGITGPVSPIPTGIRPVAMVVDPNSSFVFVANAGSNSISVFAIDQSTGALKEVNGSPFTTGATPVSLACRGTSLFVANQGAAEISAYSFDSKTGSLALVGSAAAGANTTSIEADSGGTFVYVADGTANTVTVYSTGSSGLTMTSTSVAVGSTPSDVHLDPSGKYLYVANAGSNNVSGFTIEGSGGLSPISGSPWSAGTGSSYLTSSLNGNYLFVANRGAGSVSSFQVGNGGALTPVNGSPFATSGYTSPDGLASLD
jgi:6-phosphogluconolactonase (cycloisomerase 2 family)